MGAGRPLPDRADAGIPRRPSSRSRPAEQTTAGAACSGQPLLSGLLDRGKVGRMALKPVKATLRAVLDDRGRANSGVQPPGLVVAAVVSAVAATTVALPGAAGALWTSLADGQGATLKRLTIQAPDCSLHIFAFGQLNKAESARLTRHFVANHHRRGHLKPGIGYELVEASVTDTMRKVPYIQF